MRIKVRCDCLSLRIPDLGIVMIRGEERFIEDYAFEKSKYLAKALDSGALKILDGSTPIAQIQNTKDLLAYLNQNREAPKPTSDVSTLREISKLQDTISALSQKLDHLQQASQVEVRERVVVKEVASPQDNLIIELLQALMEKVDKISSAPPQVVTQYVGAQENPRASTLHVDVDDDSGMVFIPKNISNSSLEADVKVASNKTEASASFEEASKALKARPKRSKRKRKTGDDV